MFPAAAQPWENVCRRSKTLWKFLWSLSILYWPLNRKETPTRERGRYELFENLVLNIKTFYRNLQESPIFFEVTHVVTIVGRFLSKLWLPSFCLVISWNLNHICVQFFDFSHCKTYLTSKLNLRHCCQLPFRTINSRADRACLAIVVLMYYNPTSILWKLNGFRLAIISLKV